MARAGLFADCDAVLHWHPSSRNVAGDLPTMARVAVKFRFHGTSAHAASAPERGRSALEAVALTNHAVALMREHTPDLTRIHHVITDGGGAPNVVPEFAEVYYYVRHPKADVVRALYPRLLKCAQAGALATETKLEVVHEGGIVEMLPNTALSAAAQANLTRLNEITYNAEERAFAARIQTTFSQPVPPLGARDIRALLAGGRGRRHEYRPTGNAARGPHVGGDGVRPVHQSEAACRREGRASATASRAVL